MIIFIELLNKYCLETPCRKCKLSRDGEWSGCEFKRAPRNWDKERINEVLTEYYGKILKSSSQQSTAKKKS